MPAQAGIQCLFSVVIERKQQGDAAISRYFFLSRNCVTFITEVPSVSL